MRSLPRFHRARFHIASAVVASLCVALHGFGAMAQASATSAQNPVSTARRATVTVRASAADGGKIGSGVIVASDGMILTAAHVVRGATSVQVVLPSGQSLDVYGLLYADYDMDLAVLKVDAVGLPTCPMGNSDSVSVGQRLFAIGSPLGLDLTISDGVLSSLRVDGKRKLLQVSIPVSPGSSGGPVITEDGRVVGLVVSALEGADAQNLNFALPINYAREILPIVSKRQPTAFAQAGAPTAATTTPGDQKSYRNIVNDSLNIDWFAVDGTSSFSEQQVRRSVKEQVEGYYSASTSPSGAPTLERTERLLYRVGNGAVFERYTDGFRDDDRTVLTLEGSKARSAAYYGNRVPLVQGIQPLTYSLLVSDGTAEARSGTLVQRGAAPVGAVPLKLLGAAIAGIPDPLPRSAYIWTVASDSTGIRVNPVEVQFGDSATKDVPIAVDGRRCMSGTPTRSITFPVVDVHVALGATTQDYLVLASKPHLAVVEGLRCLSLPRNRSPVPPVH